MWGKANRCQPAALLWRATWAKGEKIYRADTNLSTVDTSVREVDHDISLTGNEHAVAVCLADRVRIARDDSHNALHLLRLDLKGNP